MTKNFLRLMHPTQNQMFVEVVAASRHPQTGRKVYTLHLRYPRIIHGEMMTHRVFNRNARSSRAVPVKTMLREIRDTPFVPWHWTKAQKGMQGAKGWMADIVLKGAAALHVDADKPVSNEAAWLWGRDMICDLAESFAEAEYHKQVANRLVEPWMWMDLLVTATDWANFIHLRDHEDAEPHIRDLAALVGRALKEAPVTDLKFGEWHLPYITQDDHQAVSFGDALSRYGLTPLEALRRISAARCARISYTPFNGDAKIEAELERYELLTGNEAVHASPLEHQCTPDQEVTLDVTTFDDEGEILSEITGARSFAHIELHGSLRGFIQFRKMVPNEAVHG